MSSGATARLRAHLGFLGTDDKPVMFIGCPAKLHTPDSGFRTQDAPDGFVFRLHACYL
jgi:hypothetical protein